LVVDTPIASALIVAGNNSRVRLKWNKAQSRLERTAIGVGALGFSVKELNFYRAWAIRPDGACESTASS
jgi:hypothetical protein